MDKRLKTINIACGIIIVFMILTIILFSNGIIRTYREKYLYGKLTLDNVNSTLYNKYAYYNDNFYYIDKLDNKYYLYRYNLTYNTYREISNIDTSSDNYAIKAIGNYIIIFEITDYTNVYIYNTSTTKLSSFNADSISIINNNLYYKKYDNLYLLYLETAESGKVISTKYNYTLNDNVINVKDLNYLNDTILDNIYVYDGSSLYLKNNTYLKLTTLDNISEVYSVTKISNYTYVVTENNTYIYNGYNLIKDINISKDNVISLNDSVLFEIGDKLYYFDTNTNDLVEFNYNDVNNLMVINKQDNIFYNQTSFKYYVYHNNEIIDLQNISGTVLTSLVDSIDSLFIKDNKLYYNNLGKVDYIIDLG